MKRLIFRQSIFICVLALIPTLAATVLHPKRPSWDAEALKEGEVLLEMILNWKQPVLWVDARSAKEYQRAHIPGAMLLNEDDWDDLLNPILDAWNSPRPVVVYCDDRQCQASHQVAGRLRESGVEPVYVLKGGWETWRKQRSQR